ncbi:HutD family protein [Microbacterium sp. ZW T5_56]|uniref:HutD family protein n=1 Tax=Microbacterium sp. ZW T5_56 TaxID=3378081 RepID=UPI0038549469
MFLDSEQPVTDVDVVRPTDVPAEPWANGLGVTRVLVSRPHWRISIADIDAVAPFSFLPGRDRLQIPLTAAGVTLHGGAERRQLAPGEPVWFRGEDRVVGHPPIGGATVLNVMTDRAHAVLQLGLTRETVVTGADAVVALADARIQGRDETPGTVVLPGRDPVRLVSREAVAVLRWLPAVSAR